MVSVTYAVCHLCLVSLILSVTYKPFTLSVIMLSVDMLSIVVPSIQVSGKYSKKVGLQKYIIKLFNDKLIFNFIFLAFCKLHINTFSIQETWVGYEPSTLRL
jgi:hypothetical protein